MQMGFSEILLQTQPGSIFWYWFPLSFLSVFVIFGPTDLVLAFSSRVIEQTSIFWPELPNIAFSCHKLSLFFAVSRAKMFYILITYRGINLSKFIQHPFLLLQAMGWLLHHKHIGWELCKTCQLIRLWTPILCLPTHIFQPLRKIDVEKRQFSFIDKLLVFRLFQELLKFRHAAFVSPLKLIQEVFASARRHRNRSRHYVDVFIRHPFYTWNGLYLL